MTRISFRDFSLVIALIAIVAFFALMSPAFLSPRNLSNLSVEFAITAVLALGAFLVLLPGQTDLSTGSGVGLAGGIAAVLVFTHNWSAPVALLLSTVVTVALWVGMGWFIVKQRIPAFIMTLAGMLIFRGLHWYVIGSKTIPVEVAGQPNLYSALTTWYLPSTGAWIVAGATVAMLGWSALADRRRRVAQQLAVDNRDVAFAKWLIPVQLIILTVVILSQYNGVPLPVLVLGVTAVVVHLLTRHTPFGRHLYAIGGNREAARISGINVDRTVIVAFALLGLVVAITGFLQTAYAGGSTTTVGTLMELDAIAACVIGGVSLVGGTGSVGGVLFGALIMAALLNGMTLLSVSPEMKYIARGTVLALAVWMDQALNRK
ncbi:MAG TPA: ATPase [Planctomycetota bacterium]|nr:ATPase [Planctomycetota bacterium]